MEGWYFYAAQSAGHISHLIREIQNSTEHAIVRMENTTQQINQGVEVVMHSGDAFLSIQDAIHGVSSRIHAISEATQYLAAGGEKIVLAFDQIEQTAEHSTQFSYQFSHLSEDLHAVMQEVYRSSDQLSEMAVHLHDLINKFKVHG